MLNKLLDEPYWDEMEEDAKIFSHLTKDLSPPFDTSVAVYKLIVNFLIFFDEGVSDLCNLEQVIPLVKEHVSKNGFSDIKKELIDSIKEDLDYFLRDVQGEPVYDGERKDVDLFLKETNNIREILEFYQIYLSLAMEFEND